MKRTSVFQHIVFLVSCGLLLGACAAPTPAPTATPLPTSTAAPTATTPPTATPKPLPFAPPAEGRIIFIKPDGRKFAGMVYGQGKTAILLADMVDGGEDQWSPFIKALDKEKFTAITFMRLQGNPAGVVEETNIVLQSLRGAGYQRVICIGANFGVLSCSSIASAPEVIGSVLIGAPDHHFDLSNILKEVTAYPKLFIVGDGDAALIDRQKVIYEQASQPKTLSILPAETRSGTEMFYSAANKDAFLKLLIDFVTSLP